MNTHILTEEGPGDTTPLNSPIEVRKNNSIDLADFGAF
jgi:hypothetical protein